MAPPASVPRFLPHLMTPVLQREINPDKVSDLKFPLADVAEGYRAMDGRRVDNWSATILCLVAFVSGNLHSPIDFPTVTATVYGFFEFVQPTIDVVPNLGLRVP